MNDEIREAREKEIRDELWDSIDLLVDSEKISHLIDEAAERIAGLERQLPSDPPKRFGDTQWGVPVDVGRETWIPLVRDGRVRSWLLMGSREGELPPIPQGNPGLARSLLRLNNFSKRSVDSMSDQEAIEQLFKLLRARHEEGLTRTY